MCSVSPEAQQTTMPDQVVFADLQQPGDDDVLVKVEQDLSANSILTTRTLDRSWMNLLEKRGRN